MEGCGCAMWWHRVNTQAMHPSQLCNGGWVKQCASQYVSDLFPPRNWHQVCHWLRVRNPEADGEPIMLPSRLKCEGVGQDKDTPDSYPLIWRETQSGTAFLWLFPFFRALWVYEDTGKEQSKVLGVQITQPKSTRGGISSLTVSDSDTVWHLAYKTGPPLVSQ